ncbi:hypothetical protein JZ751_019401 [Albula glossodonta]|uniref:Uncharacterized protein n=1 Tax=Albula glossodonta TaxID=121402 RepID=A0A8T2NM34_9TELE|nr:hypothetical protein JZ751_019401 [Albula glossodonta]
MLTPAPLHSSAQADALPQGCAMSATNHTLQGRRAPPLPALLPKVPPSGLLPSRGMPQAQTVVLQSLPLRKRRMATGGSHRGGSQTLASPSNPPHPLAQKALVGRSGEGGPA